MALSTELIAAIQSASSSLSTNTDGELILPERKQSWRAMGELLLEGNRAIKGIGLRRRTKLARLCVQKVLALWDEVWPDNDGPRQMLITADQYLNGAIDYDVAWERKNSYWSKLDGLIYEGNHLTIVNVGFAAVKVVTTALVDEIFDPQDPEEDIRDESLDPYQWYLSEAVPSAWEA